MWIKKRRLLTPLLILLLPLVVGVAGAGNGGDATNGIHPEAEVLEENGAAGRAEKGEEPGLSLKDLEGLEETLDGIVTELVSKFGDVNDESFWHPYFATQDSREGKCGRGRRGGGVSLNVSVCSVGCGVGAVLPRPPRRPPLATCTDWTQAQAPGPQGQGNTRHGLTVQGNRDLAMG